MKQKPSYFLKLTCLSLCLSLGLPAISQANGLASLFGQSSQNKFLPVHQAFGVSATQEGDELVVTIKVTPEHYAYRDKLQAKLPKGVSLGDWQFDRSPTWVDDPTFGRVAVFEQDVVARAKLSSQSGVNERASIRWQGCAKAGLCYPPENTHFQLQLAGGQAQQSDQATQASQPKTNGANQAVQAASTQAQASSKNVRPNTPTKQEMPNDQAIKDQTALVAKISDVKADAEVGDQVQPKQTPEQSVDAAKHVLPVPSLANQGQGYALSHQLPASSQQTTHPVLMIGLLFLAGLLLSLTPCVYPMVPIVANIVAKSQSNNARRGFLLSAAYGVGVAFTYGLLGALISWFGQALGVAGWFQKPWVLMAAAALFVVFALMMADLIHLRLPLGLGQKLQEKSQLADDRLGSLSGSFLAGALSALVVSPCVSAPMAGALTAVSASGNILFGFAALFALGLGLSVPLMIMGAAQGRWMPKAGEWMVRVRELGALLLLAVAVSLIERVLFSSWILLLWAVWFVLAAMWLWRLQKTLRLLAFLPLVWSACLLVGVALGSQDAWHPLSKLTQVPAGQQTYQDLHISSLEELDDILKSTPKVLVDVTADWCIECRIMERTLFTNRPSSLNQYQVVKLDVSQTTDQSRAVLSRYQLFGPPALLIYQQGKLEQVLLGEVKRADFEEALTK